MWKLECKYSTCRVFDRVPYNERDWYAVVVVKDGVVVKFLSKAVSRILAELHVLSKSIILELISFKNICLLNFCGFINPRDFFNDEKFPDYMYGTV